MANPETVTASDRADIYGATVLADRLGIFAVALIVVYLAGLLTSILPPRILDPVWQLSAIKVFIESAALPLLSLGLIHLAAFLAPHDNRLKRRREAMARMAILAALGFLLIIPLQSYLVWKTYTDTKASVTTQQSEFTAKAESIRQAVELSSSPQDLQKRLQALQGPGLRIRFDQANFSAIPLALLKQQILSQLNQSEGRFKSTIRDPDQNAVEGVIRASLKTIISAAAFAVAFAAGAQRNRSPVPFLVEVPSLPGHMIRSLRPRRSRPGQGNAGTGFLKSPSRREEELFMSLAPPEDEEPPAP